MLRSFGILCVGFCVGVCVCARVQKRRRGNNNDDWRCERGGKGERIIMGILEIWLIKSHDHLSLNQ